MFRRKDESAIDFSADASANQTPASVGSDHTANNVATPAPAAVTQHTAPASNYTPAASATPYMPTTAPATAPLRPVASAVGYRPTPVAEFTRNASARVTETPRPTAAASQQAISAAAFNNVTEKSSSSVVASTKPNRRVLTVGNDILLKGEIATCDRLMIEGRVEAKLSDVHTVEIAECGSFKGTAEVEDAEINGVFEGDLVVRNRLVIYATGEVRGNISYGEIEIERGGKLTGQIKTVSAAAGAGKTSEKSSDKARASKESVAA